MSACSGASPYKINVRKSGRIWKLYNYSAICGDRLIKGPGFPFRNEGWNTYTKLKDAEAAAVRLQAYLDKQPDVRD